MVTIMGRMIPSRVRNQGIELYEQGLVEVISKQGDVLKAKVETYQLQYSLKDHYVRCDCDFFAKKKYCQHIAAIEYYLKNNAEGKALSKELISHQEKYQETKKVTSFGSLFLDGLSMNDDDTTKYRLSAQGSQSPYSSDYWWTLKINRLPDERSYIIRDIKAFLTTVKNESHYQIGKHFFEPLSLIQFDKPSQDLILFLWRLLPSGNVDLEYFLPNHRRHLALTSGTFEEGVKLLTHLYAFSFEYNHHTYSQLFFKALEGSEELLLFKVFVRRQSIELIIEEKTFQPLFENAFLFASGIIYRLNLKQQKILTAIRSLPIESDLAKHLFFNLEDQSKLASSLLDFKILGRVEAPKSFDIHDFTPYFYLELNDYQEIILKMVFDYGFTTVSNTLEKENLPFSSHIRHEKQVFRTLEINGFSPEFTSYHAPLTSDMIYDFFTNTLAQLETLGKVTLSKELSEMKQFEYSQVAIQPKGHLLDISFDFSTIFEEDIDVALEALFKNQSYFINKTGKLILFDEKTQHVNRILTQLHAKQLTNGHLQLEKASALHLSDLLKKNDIVSFSKEFEQLVDDLRHPERFQVTIPKLNTTLRDYQITGIRWLSMLDHYGFGGVLADDMGLGKTLQTIAFLATILKPETRALILSPSSVIYNWYDEFQRFAPNIDVAVAFGLKSVREDIISQEHQVIITSYASFRQDFETYRQNSFDYLILDEAQVIKNTQTQLSDYLRRFNVNNCFALSGTPIENKLLEIWSIFQIVLPGLLPNKKQFLKMDAKQVAHFIRPFIMRRRKEDVLLELPDLTEINCYNELSQPQKAIYLAQLRQIQKRIEGASDVEINRHKIEILSGLMRLRQICDSPSLFMDYHDDSGKLASLRTLLLPIKENGHRVLIFSQFKGMLDIVEKEITKLGLSSYKLTGSTPTRIRQEMIDSFNGGSKDAFLISLKAGGVGLNLTGADTVILLDIWWNPAIEMQAISRAHRIGQKENVKVYRLITRGTIEEKILALQENKRHLVTTVLDGNETRAHMTADDIKAILGIS